jgi:hypothetical protein
VIHCCICREPIPDEDFARGVIVHKVNPKDETRSCRKEFALEKRNARKRRKITAGEWAIVQQCRRKKITPEKLAENFPQRRRQGKASEIVNQAQQ